jgi:thioredoxin 1
VLMFPPGAESQPQQTPYREPETEAATDFARDVPPPAPDKSSTSKPLQETFRRKAEEAPPAKPARQTPLHIETMRDFDTHVLDAGGICLVDLFSNRCPPCQVLAPTISSLARKYAGKVTVCKVNVDYLPAVARRYGIRAIPTILIVKDGKVVNYLVGLRPEAQYVAVLDRLLAEAGR